MRAASTTRSFRLPALLAVAAAPLLTTLARAQDIAPAGYRHIAASDCFGCHRYDSRLVGPAFKEIAARYQGDAAAPARLAAKIKAGGAGNWGEVPMLPHPGLSDTQLAEIVQWILAGEPPPKAQVSASAPPAPTPAAPAAHRKTEYANALAVAGLPPITPLPPPPDALRGRDLFHGKAGCIQCHNGPLVSDQKFHALGLPEHELVRSDAMAQITHRFEQYIKGVSADIYQHADADLGLFYVTKNPADRGKFRTPSLRELKYTAPYMHNGVLATLDDVVAFYDQGGGDHPNKSPLIHPLQLADDERRDLVAFLMSLSSDEPITTPVPITPDYAPLPSPLAADNPR